MLAIYYGGKSSDFKNHDDIDAYDVDGALLLWERHLKNKDSYTHRVSSSASMFEDIILKKLWISLERYTAVVI